MLGKHAFRSQDTRMVSDEIGPGLQVCWNNCQRKINQIYFVTHSDTQRTCSPMQVSKATTIIHTYDVLYTCLIRWISFRGFNKLIIPDSYIVPPNLRQPFFDCRETSTIAIVCKIFRTSCISCKFWPFNAFIWGIGTVMYKCGAVFLLVLDQLMAEVATGVTIPVRSLSHQPSSAHLASFNQCSHSSAMKAADNLLAFRGDVTMRLNAVGLPN